MPDGTITFLFTDIEGSTKLWETRQREMGRALARHDAILRECVAKYGGHIVKTVGDGFFTVFATAPAALQAAMSMQLAIQSEPWSLETKIRIRIAMHSGTAELRDRDYYGPAVNRVARLLGIAHGGQTLLTQASRDLCRDALPQQVSLKRLGEHALKDLAHPEVVYQLGHPSLREEFPESRPLAPKPVVAGLSRVGPPASSLVDTLTDLPPLYGRADDLAAVCGLIRSHSLVTVVGTGGIGKTRLAQAVELELRDEFPDGVRMVELAPITDPLLVGAAVARALGVSTGDPQRALDLAVHALAGQRLLLVLDNCEHLMDSVERVVAAFRKGAPSVRILATSQELLRHPEEQVYRLDTLVSARLSPQPKGLATLVQSSCSLPGRRQRTPDFKWTTATLLCRHLQAARRHSAGNRACGGAGAAPRCGRGARAAR